MLPFMEDREQPETRLICPNSRAENISYDPKGKAAWSTPTMTRLSGMETEAKVSSPGENGIVTGPS